MMSKEFIAGSVLAIGFYTGFIFILYKIYKELKKWKK